MRGYAWVVGGQGHARESYPGTHVTGPVRATGGMRTARSAGGERTGPGGSRHATLVLASKLRLPARRPGAVVRQPLLSRLSEDRPARLVVISAPAGWGENCLLP